MAAGEKLGPDGCVGQDGHVIGKIVHGLGEIAANFAGGAVAQLVGQAGRQVRFMDHARNLHRGCRVHDWHADIGNSAVPDLVILDPFKRSHVGDLLACLPKNSQEGVIGGHMARRSSACENDLFICRNEPNYFCGNQI